MSDIKKFLDQGGVSTLWSRIAEELNKKAAANDVYTKDEVDNQIFETLDYMGVATSVPSLSSRIDNLQQDVLFKCGDIDISISDLYKNLREVSEQLRELKEKIDLSIVNARYQKPIDTKLFDKLLKKYKNIFIYEETTYINSLGSYLVNYANKENYKGTIEVFAIKDEFIKQGKKEEVLKLLELDEKSITKKIKKSINNKD